MTSGLRASLMPGDLIENTLGIDKHFNIDRPYNRSCYPTEDCFWGEQPWNEFKFCKELILIVYVFIHRGGTLHALCVVDGKVGWIHIDNAYATVVRCDDRQ